VADPENGPQWCHLVPEVSVIGEDERDSRGFESSRSSDLPEAFAPLSIDVDDVAQVRVHYLSTITLETRRDLLGRAGIIPE